MTDLTETLAALPTIALGGRPHLAYRAAADVVAAHLYPDTAAGDIDEAGYRHVLETADRLCRALGYREVVKLTPPQVGLAETGLYWTTPQPDPEPEIIHVGPGPAAMLADGQLLDARLGRLELADVTRQHFKIPATASDGVVDLLHRAVASDWPNDYPGLWHDILGMCIAAGRDDGPDVRRFTVLIRGLKRRYWHFTAQLHQDNTGAPYLHIRLADEAGPDAGPQARFDLGQVVMTPGVADLGVDVAPYIARHAAGDWGELDAFDRRQNEGALRAGGRLLSAYEVDAADGESVRIWIITEADRACTTVLLPKEY